MATQLNLVRTRVTLSPSFFFNVPNGRNSIDSCILNVCYHSITTGYQSRFRHAIIQVHPQSAESTAHAAGFIAFIDL